MFKCNFNLIFLFRNIVFTLCQTYSRILLKSGNCFWLSAFVLSTTGVQRNVLIYFNGIIFLFAKIPPLNVGSVMVNTSQSIFLFSSLLFTY